MTDQLCGEWHNRRVWVANVKVRHSPPRAKYLVRHRDDKKARPMCGVHARWYRRSVERLGGYSGVWIVEEIA